MEILIGFAITLLVVVILFIASGIRIVQPYEQALWIYFGKFKRRLDSGVNWVMPFGTQVVKLDLRTQVLDVAKQDVITKDNSPTTVDAIIYIKVIDPAKSFFEVTNYKLATVALAQTTLRSVIGEMELDEVLYNRAAINTRLRDLLDKATDVWGVKVESVEIREVEPVARVKSAMEEQTSAERERRAAILRADGTKRAKILEAEGEKRSRILAAEGVRQSKILEAEGERQARILEAQGEAQKLRILSLGALPLDQKALTVLSLEAIKKLGEGQATKIIFPFEISKLLEGVGEYIGISRKIPEREPVKYEEIEKIVGKTEDVLGEIKIKETVTETEDEKEENTSEEILKPQKKSKE